MIVVEARLDRTVYLAGEVLECFVSFTNQTSDSAVPLNSDSESLAWASAQLHCQCSVSEARVVWPGEDTGEVPHGQEGSDTVFIPSRGERGHTVLSTAPRILFCDLKLHQGETKTYLYREVIPREAPPSYRGHSVKYSYKVTIGTQRVGAPTKLLRVPFRVLVVYADLGDPTVYEEVPPSNPFLEEQRQEGSLLELASQVLTTITARKSPNVYNITNQRGTVGKFTLFKSAYRIGEDIVGSFDYAGATVPCMQFTVTLQSEEHIAEECRRKPSQAVATMSFSRHHEFCLHTQRGHMILPIPLSATPSFMTDIVTVRWRLHFEFVLACSPISQPELPTGQSESATWQGPSTVAVDTMVWDLPIKVLPTNPLQATAVSLIKSSNSIKV